MAIGYSISERIISSVVGIRDVVKSAIAIVDYCTMTRLSEAVNG